MQSLLAKFNTQPVLLLCKQNQQNDTKDGAMQPKQANN